VSYQLDWCPAGLLAASIDKGFLLASLFSICGPDLPILYTVLACLLAYSAHGKNIAAYHVNYLANKRALLLIT
jgi:hypothetical protein